MSDPPKRPDEAKPASASPGPQLGPVARFKSRKLTQLDKGLLIISGLVVAGLVVAALTNPGDSKVGSTMPEPQGNGVHFEVTKCDFQSADFATATVEVTVDQPEQLLTFTGDYIQGGVSIGQGVGTLANVAPGQTYRTDIVYSLTGADESAGGTCQVHLDSVLD